MAGIKFDPKSQMRWLETALAPYMSGFSRWLAQDPGAFVLKNGSFEDIDAEVLYALVRYLKPNQLIEIGSGYSTLVSAAAGRANATQGHPMSHVVVDPHPSEVLRSLPAEQVILRPIPAEELAAETFDSLETGDIVFVDGTHTVKIGSDVNFVVLDVLPRLRPGVVVHFHDVFLPFEYPREWMERDSFFWNEQYLLQAFLALNRDYEVLCATYCLLRRYPEQLAAVVPSYSDGSRPGSFWLRRIP